MEKLKIDRRREKQIEYDVALSFAEEDRDFVESVASILKASGIKYYYYGHDRDRAWGMDLKDYLDEVYREKARFCVIFCSESYKKKIWTLFEKERAQARAFFMKKKAYVLPFRLDKAEMPGLTDSIGYLSLDTHNEKQLVDAIFNKIESSKPYWQYIRQRFRPLFSKRAAGFSLLAIIGCIGVSWLPDKLTPRDDLAKKLHERSKEIYHGATCNDSTFSHSRGKGTCSHHEGVAYYRDSIEYHKTIEECRVEAAEISWLP